MLHINVFSRGPMHGSVIGESGACRMITEKHPAVFRRRVLFCDEYILK